MLTAADLIAFEDEIAADFATGKIKAPVHLAGGNEEQLIALFRQIRPQDWVCGAWRMHYHCLLKGVPPAELRRAIHDGRSIALCFPEQRVISSAIVGGIAPIALGIAGGIHERGLDERVYCFLGDMSAETGLVHECKKYSAFLLPIVWVTEDNGIGGTHVPTRKVWGEHDYVPNVVHYRYALTRPFVGIGRHIPL